MSTVVLRGVRGELDAGLSPRLEAVAQDVVAAGRPVVLDVAAVTFMDSTVAAFIAALVRGLGADRVTMVQPSDQVQFLLAVTKLGSMVRVVARVDARIDGEAST